MSRQRESLDEVVRRAAGERSASAARAARRRQGAADEAAPPLDVTTDVHPEDVVDRAARLSRRRGELRVPGVSAGGLRDLQERIDENLGHTAPAAAALIEVCPRLGPLCGVTPAQLEADTRTWAEMGNLRGTTTLLRTSVERTRRELAGLTRGDLQAAAEWVEAQLRPGALPREQQGRLRSDTLEFMTAWARVKAEPQAERDKTLSENATHAAALSAEATRAEALRAVLTLHEGGPADQAEWDNAAARYDALVASAEAERRSRAR